MLRPEKFISYLHSSFTAIENANLWHLRLGRIFFNKIKSLHESVDVQGCITEQICQICLVAKGSRQPFPLSRIYNNKAWFKKASC